MSNHIAGFIKAVKGGRGDLDAWLECNNEEECRVAILGAIAQERELCAQEVDHWGGIQKRAGSISVWTDYVAAAIRGRGDDVLKTHSRNE